MDSIREIQAQCQADSEFWFATFENPVYQSLPLQTLALCGEAGELANLVKKLVRGDLDPKDDAVVQAIADEVVDVLIYLANVANILNLDLGEGYDIKREFNSRRFTRDGGTGDPVFNSDGEGS